MGSIIIPTFGGEVPRTTARLLGDTQAAKAVNCQLQRGALEPLLGPLQIASLPSSASTIFKHPTDGWLSWSKSVDVVKSAVLDIAGETPLGHLFITGDKDYPTQYLKGGIVRRLGIPRPGKAPTIGGATGAVAGTAACYAWGADADTEFPARYGSEATLSTIQEDNVTTSVIAESDSSGETTSSTDSGINRSSAYCYTVVQSLADGIFQQESAPSPASDVVDVKDGDGVTISGFDIPQLQDLQITHIRIYRTVSGTKTSDFHFLVEIPASTVSYVDTTSDLNISSSLLETTTWDAIPGDARGLIKTDNGIYAAFRGNELLISEPFYSYVFPESYRLTTEDPIVALGHVDSTIVVLTTGRPYLASGSEPESLQFAHLPIEQSCVSARSVGSLPGGVVYASPDGLMLFSSSDQSLLTEQTFTREQWQALHPENILGAVHDGRYVAFFAGTGEGLIFSLGAKDIVRISLQDGWKVQGMYNHSEDDALYLSVDNQDGSCVYKFEAGEPLEFTWKSKPFFTSALSTMTAVRIEGEVSSSSPVIARVYGGYDAGSRARAKLTITNNRAKRLPTTRAEKLWSLELSGKSTVYEARLGGSVEGVEYGN